MPDDRSETAVVALTTVPDSDAALALAERLLDERLIACANVLPGATSVYRWEGSLRTESEVLVVLKSLARFGARLSERIVELHPYDVPEVLILDATGGSDSYLDWIRAEVRAP